MPLKLPNLDDWSYDDLVREALAKIPAHAPEWTNHNPSDPGITLVELLAFVTEILIYRTNQTTEAQLAVFLSLLTGSTRRSDGPILDQIQSAIVEMRRPTRCVTPEDYEKLAISAAPHQVARAYCVPLRNMTVDRIGEREGHVSVVIVAAPGEGNRSPAPSPELLKKIRAKLEPCRLLTTFLHVVPPVLVPINISANVVLTPHAAEKARTDVTEAFRKLLDPVGQPPLYQGWQFGRCVYVSELYNFLEQQPGVDYVATLDLKVADEKSAILNAQGELIGVRLQEDELPQADLRNFRVSHSETGLGEPG